MIDFEADADKLRELWNAADESGKPLYSVSAIGKILGLNKNQMTGKKNRLAKKYGGFNPRLNAVHETGTPGPPRPVNWVPHKPSKPPKPLPVLITLPSMAQPHAQPKTPDQSGVILPFILEPHPHRPPSASNRGCQWPIGHPGEPNFHFCGDHRDIGRPYCAKHAAIAYIQPYRSRA